MAPSFEHLHDEEEEDDDGEGEIDFSDLHQKYQVQLEQGLDAFVVIDGLPVVPKESKERLLKFILRKLNTAGKTRQDQVYMPVDDQNMTEGFAFVEFETPAEAANAIKTLHGAALDKKHTMAVNKLTDIERYGREGRIDEKYTKPDIEPFQEQEHLRWWLGDHRGRDQFVMYRGDDVVVYMNNKKDEPESIIDRKHWTDTFVQWSPQGTFLTSMHQQGVQLWGGKSWSRQKRFAHPFVNLAEFSPNEKYITTWSNRPIQVDEGHPVLSADDDGKNYIIWDIETGKPLRSFATVEAPPTIDQDGNQVKRKIQWPAFKWSADDKYVARLNAGQSISIYELPRMILLDKATVKIDGIVDFEWAPAAPQREGIKSYEQLLCYWTPEIGSNPAKVGLMSIPSKEIVRTRNLFNVSDAKLHWQSQAAYLCIKVDRHSKSKKSLATNLEIFRVREKGVPVEVVDSIKDTVINFAWEPKGDRFVLITTAEVAAPTAVPPKTSVSFFCPEKIKGAGVGNFKHIRTIDKKNSNAIYWSPKGRFVIVATVHSQQGHDIEFWDLDYEGEKPESEKDLTANLQLMNTADHYGVTDVDWDPSGRFVATSASMWKHAMDNGYHLYDFKGTQLREAQIDKFKQWAWRPRPPTLLSKDEQKSIRKNLRVYSRDFEYEDAQAESDANTESKERRRGQLSEWLAWRAAEQEDLLAERRSLGLPDTVEEMFKRERKEGEEDQVIEEIVEEIVDETEEVIP